MDSIIDMLKLTVKTPINRCNAKCLQNISSYIKYKILYDRCETAISMSPIHKQK